MSGTLGDQGRAWPQAEVLEDRPQDRRLVPRRGLEEVLLEARPCRSGKPGGVYVDVAGLHPELIVPGVAEVAEVPIVDPDPVVDESTHLLTRQPHLVRIHPCEYRPRECWAPGIGRRTMGPLPSGTWERAPSILSSMDPRADRMSSRKYLTGLTSSTESGSRWNTLWGRGPGWTRREDRHDVVLSTFIDGFCSVDHRPGGACLLGAPRFLMT